MRVSEFATSSLAHKSLRNFFAKIINNPKEALSYAKKIAGRNDLVVVTGSIYMVGEVV